MGFIPSNSYKIDMHGHLAARIEWASSLHVMASGIALSQANADSIAANIGDAWEDSGLLAYLSTGWSLDKYVVTDLQSSSAPQYESVSGIQTGADAGQVLPGQTAGMIEWGTAHRGRSFRGRSFFCGFTENASDGLPLVGVVQALTLFASGLIGDMNTLGFPLAVVSNFSGTHLVNLPNGETVKRPTPRANGLVTQITRGLGEEVWKTQRRRAFPG
jgi:hypothetical protein